jgi:cytochrome c553
MPRSVVWVMRLVAVAAGLALLAMAAVYAGSERVRHRTWDVPVAPLPPLPRDAGTIAEGERFARILGCYGGCHGAQLEGAVVSSAPGVAEIVAPNLTAVLPAYSDAELARAIRHGVRRDGTGLFAMPSEAFVHLADEDLLALTAFLRRQPRSAHDPGRTRVGPLGRLWLVSGWLAPVPATLDHAQPRLPRGGAADPVARGRYLAQVACAECHGRTLQGGMDGRAPSLAVAAVYADEAFRHLLRTGETPGRRDLFVMDDVARARFAWFTDAEIEALHLYLRSLAARTP